MKLRGVSSVLTLALFQISLTVGLWGGGGAVAQSSETIWPVQATPLDFTTHEIERVFSGTVSSPGSVDLSFAMAGCITQVSPDVRNGAGVGQGAALFMLDDREAQLSLQVALASAAEQSALVDEKRIALDAARARLDRQDVNNSRAQDLLQRDIGLAERNLISSTEVEATRRRAWEQEDAVANAREAVRQAEAALRLSEAARERVASEVNKAALNLETHSISASYDGVLEDVAVQVGDCVSSGQRLATLIPPQIRQVDLFVPLAILEGQGGLQPRIGTQTQVLKANGAACPGEISSIAGMVLAESQMVKVTIAVALDCAPSHFLNEAVQVSLVVRKLENTAALPAAAVRENERVFVVDGDNRLASRVLTELYIFDGIAYVQFEPDEATQVVTAPPALAVEGMAVLIVPDRP